MNIRAHAAQLGADVEFIAARLLTGVWAYSLLLLGLAGATAVTAAAVFAAVFVLPFVAAALAIAWLAGRLGRPFPARLRARLAGGPLRRTVLLAATVARGFAAVVLPWLLACRATARRERARIEAFRDVAVPIAYRPLPEGRLPALRVAAADQATWRDLAYLLLGPLYAFAATLAVAGMWIGGVAVVVSAPSTGALDPAAADPAVWAMAAAGIGLLLVAPFATRLLAHGAAALGAALLSTSESARMRAELDEQRLRRQLAVDAAERERRRIERDLHDGAQQRLVALGMSLGLALETLPTDPAAGTKLVAEAHRDAKLALAELRDLARGIHPAILGDRGLDAALSALVRRTPVPVSVVVTLPHRPPTAVESAAYFLVTEALTNVARHARATRATVTIREAGGTLLVEVGDDGDGGADPAAGTGLAGLHERVAALGGRMTVDSRPGGPTTITAEIPCRS